MPAVGADVIVIAEENAAIRSEGLFADAPVRETAAAVGRPGEVNVGAVVGISAAVVEDEVEDAGGLVDVHPGEELLFAGGVVVDADGLAPAEAAVFGIGQPNVGVIRAVALVASRAIDAARRASSWPTVR